MPTRIEEIYDALATTLESTLTGYVRFPNPYVIAENTYLHMKSGYGLAVGPGTDTERLVGCQISWERSFTVVLVKQIMTTQNNTGNRVLVEKDILDDHDALRKAVYNNSTLGGKAIKTTLVSDGGVNFIDGDRLKFLSMEIEIVTEYLESST
jgi:hypothetical protein